MFDIDVTGSDGAIDLYLELRAKSIAYFQRTGLAAHIAVWERAIDREMHERSEKNQIYPTL